MPYSASGVQVPTSRRQKLPPGGSVSWWRAKVRCVYTRVANSSTQSQLAVIGLASLVVGLLLYRQVLPDDFVVYRDAAQRLLHDPGDIYAHRAALPFTYPPIAVVLFVPLALLPGWLGAALLLAASLTALLRCSQILSRWLQLGNHWPALTGVAIMLEPVISTLAYGQMNIILAAMVLVGLDGRVAASAWLGLAAAIKLTPAVFFGPLLLKGSWSRFALGMSALVVATGAGFILLPDQSTGYWRETFLDASRVGGVAYAGNQSINGLLCACWDQAARGCCGCFRF